MPFPALTSRPHADAVRQATEFFSDDALVDGVLLVGSWARGHASDSSDLDIAVLVRPDASARERDELVSSWERSSARSGVAELLRPLVRYSGVEIAVIDGEFAPEPRQWTSGPDGFELEIGNYIAHSVTLFERGTRFSVVRDSWLPFYGEELRATRLATAQMYCLNNLDHVPWSLERGDRFHAFHRLYHAYQEFLQTLFIARRTYPLAYDKWIAEQLGELLGLEELVDPLSQLVGIPRLDEKAIADSAVTLARLLDEHVATASPS